MVEFVHNQVSGKTLLILSTISRPWEVTGGRATPPAIAPSATASKANAAPVKTPVNLS